MPQQAITIELQGLDAEHVEQVCFAAGAVSVVLTDCRDDAILEPAPGEVRLWPSTRLQALYTEPLSTAAVTQLAADIGCAPSRLELSEIADRVWEREWLRDFQPMRFGERLWICPSHATVEEQNAVVVRLDPGLAFGTGTHPTTRLCLEYLDARSARDAGAASETPRVIDYGCGSGVLAIAALRLGAAHAVAYDIDPQALTATRDNALANDVAQSLTIASDAPEPPLAAELLLANILSGPLCELAPRLAALVAPSGELVLAGLLEEQAAEVIAAYRPWLTLRRWRALEGWVCLAGSREADGRAQAGEPA
ncbi:MAG: 50S ribosomal protein L11 methyltransferase [Sinobacteraceae bacterium]|nr:50S ribosomal protein L11 methyltransferase [Nevskiaceae bacterium]